MIDIKTLRIGSHVEYEGKRVRICSLKTNMANYDDGKGKPRCFGSNLAYYKRMQPIPITPDLLKKLGFKCTDNGRVQSWWLDFFCLDYLSGKGYFNFGVIHLKYLHELESLFYMICGVELIKE